MALLYIVEFNYLEGGSSITHISFHHEQATEAAMLEAAAIGLDYNDTDVWSDSVSLRQWDTDTQETAWLFSWVRNIDLPPRYRKENQDV